MKKFTDLLDNGVKYTHGRAFALCCVGIGFLLVGKNDHSAAVGRKSMLLGIGDDLRLRIFSVEFTLQRFCLCGNGNELLSHLGDGGGKLGHTDEGEHQHEKEERRYDDACNHGDGEGRALAFYGAVFIATQKDVADEPCKKILFAFIFLVFHV